MATPAYGLLPSGYVAPRGGDLLTFLRAQIEADLGVTIDWSPDSVLSAITSAAAATIALPSASTQAIWDGFDRENAVGLQLDAIGALTGTYRNRATYSTCTVTLSGVAGSIIPDGSQVQGGGTDGSARWRIPTSTTLDGGGTADVVVVAVDPGVVTADVGDISTIVTPAAGWSGVTNAAAATPGAALESDATYRLRQVQELGQAGAYSPAALRAKLLALRVDGAAVITSCVVANNASSSVRTIGGLSFPPHSFAPVVWPAPLTDPQIQAVATAMFKLPIPPGSWSAGPLVSDSTGFAAVVTGDDGFPHPIRGYYAALVTIPVAVTLTMARGYALSDVQSAVVAAIQGYFAALAVGQTVLYSQLFSLIQAVNVKAIAGISLLINGSAANYDPAITEIVQLSGVPTVTT